MTKYEYLVQEVPIPFDDRASISLKFEGLYIETGKKKAILVNKRIAVTPEKLCILAEELGHYYTSTGNLFDQSKIVNIKQEKRARNWAYDKLIPLHSLVAASKEGICNRFELAEFLDVTESFLEEAIKHFQRRYGPYAKWASYVINFDPFGVFKT